MGDAQPATQELPESDQNQKTEEGSPFFGLLDAIAILAIFFFSVFQLLYNFTISGFFLGSAKTEQDVSTKLIATLVVLGLGTVIAWVLTLKQRKNGDQQAVGGSLTKPAPVLLYSAAIILFVASTFIGQSMTILIDKKNKGSLQAFVKNAAGFQVALDYKAIKIDELIAKLAKSTESGELDSEFLNKTQEINVLSSDTVISRSRAPAGSFVIASSDAKKSVELEVRDKKWAKNRLIFSGQRVVTYKNQKLYFEYVIEDKSLVIIKGILVRLVGLIVLISICIPMTVQDDLKFNTAALGLSLADFPKQVLLGLRLYLCCLPLIAAVILGCKLLGPILGVTEIDHALSQLVDPNSWQSIGLLFASAVVVTPVVEEFLFRGLMLPAAAKRYGTGFAIFVTAIAFSAMHTGFLANTLTFVLGLIFAGITYQSRDRSIVASVAAHTMHNFVVLLLFLVGQ